jgi:acyl-CoA reductase-like NAD-dependent aldehyde dehydrogenase
MITEHPGIDKISFTGSTLTGKRVMANCANTLKRVTRSWAGTTRPSSVTMSMSMRHSKGISPQFLSVTSY